MMTGSEPDRWGRDTPSLIEGRPVAALPPRLTGLAALQERRVLEGPEDPWGKKPRPEELPEVAELAGQGWPAMRWFPPWAAAPGVWPAELRGWIPNRLPDVGIIGSGLRRHVEPSRSDHDEVHAGFARQSGLASPPAGRWWLLRSPWASVGTDVVLRLMWRRARELDERLLPRAMRLAVEEMLGWSEDQLWDWWPDDHNTAVARQWAARDEVGEAVADVVAVGISPGALTTLTEDGGLSRSQAVGWMRAAEGNVEQVLAMRARGLPAEPPAGLFSLPLASPQEIDLWTSHGYSVYEAFHLLGQPLEPALELRTAGIEAPEAADQLRAAAATPRP